MGNLSHRKKKERDRGRRLAAEAWEAAERSDLDGAEKLLRQALKGREGDCLLWNDLGLILWRKETLRDAEKAFRTALLLAPAYEDAKMNLASLLASRGFYRQALRLAEELARPGTPRFEFHQKRVEEYRAAAETRSAEGDEGTEDETATG